MPSVASRYRHAHIDDDDAIDQANQYADREADERCRSGITAHDHHHIGRRHHRRGGDRADRQIEAAHDKCCRHSERENAGDRYRLENEDGALWRGKTAGDQREIKDHPGEKDEKTVFDRRFPEAGRSRKNVG